MTAVTVSKSRSVVLILSVSHSMRINFVFNPLYDSPVKLTWPSFVSGRRSYAVSEIPKLKNDDIRT